MMKILMMMNLSFKLIMTPTSLRIALKKYQQLIRNRLRLPIKRLKEIEKYLVLDQ